MMLGRIGLAAVLAIGAAEWASYGAWGRDLSTVAGSTGKSVEITQAYVETTGDLTCFQIESIGRVRAQIYAIKDPDRVVIDAPSTRFRLARQIQNGSGGLVRTFRYGLQVAGDARIVLDVAKGTQVARISRDDIGRGRYRLSVALSSKTKASEAFCGGLRRLDEVALGQNRHIPTKSPLEKHDRPVVVIDPGHGGVDPGAVVNAFHLEKSIVLAVARRVIKLLKRRKDVDAFLTRDDDTFISLDGRIERTRALKGDLFISLHADAVENVSQMTGARGAAVYTLSHRASHAEAKKLAEKENAADRLGGILSKASIEKEGVRNILVDLLKRETERESARLSKLLVGAMRGKLALSKDPYRSAAFRVLKQTETPAVLIELGYMTNPHDLRLMRQAEWQERMAKAISDAVLRFLQEK